MARDGPCLPADGKGMPLARETNRATFVGEWEPIVGSRQKVSGRGWLLPCDHAMKLLRKSQGNVVTMTIRHLCLLILAWNAVANVPPISAQQITHFHPACWTPGQMQRVTFFGSQLTNVTQLWTSAKGKATRASDVPPADATVVFDIFVDPAASPGIEGVRVVGETAMSEAKLVVIDTMLRTVEMGNNNPSMPQKLSLPMSVSGFVLPEETDFYAIDVAAGQRITIEVVGHRMGTALDPLVRIVGPDGKEFMVLDNDDGFDYDLRSSVTFPAAGTYKLEVRDARFQGGLWPYVLRLGDFPQARVGYPASNRASSMITLMGTANREIPPILINVVDFLSSTSNLVAKGKDGPAWITVASSRSAGLVEVEPNNIAAEGNAFEPGRPIDARFDYPGDIDAFRCHLLPQQVLFVRSTTRRLGSPADLYLRILDSAGNEVLSADDQADDDAELSYTASAAGMYTLLVEDLNRRGGADFVYHLETFLPREEVVLRPSVDRLVIPRGTSMPMALSVERQSVAEPIALSASIQADDSGLQSRASLIPAGAGSAVVVWDAAGSGPPTTATARVSGSWNKSGEATSVRSVGATLTSLLRPKLEQIVLFPPTLETAIAVAVVDPPFFRLTAQGPAPGLGRYLSASVEVTAQRDKFAEEPIAVTIENLPANITAAAGSIEKGKRSLAMTIESKPGSATGSFPVWVTGTSTFGGRTVRVASEVVMLIVRPAVLLTPGSAETTIEIGKKQTVIVKGDRLPGAQVSLAITWPNLPAGITASPATVPEGQGEVAVELSADASAKPGSYPGVVARSVYTINGQQETVDSTPLVLQVIPASP
jgi:hypothetical protein